MADPFGMFPLMPGRGWGVVKSPSFATRVQKSINGRELRILDQSVPKWKWTIPLEFLRDKWDLRQGEVAGSPLHADGGLGYPVSGPLDELRNIMGIFLALQGQSGGFALLDQSDCWAIGEYIGNMNYGSAIIADSYFGTAGLNYIVVYIPFGATPSLIGQSCTLVDTDGQPLGPFAYPTYVIAAVDGGLDTISNLPVSILYLSQALVLPISPRQTVRFQVPLIFRRTFWTQTENVGFVTQLIPWEVRTDLQHISPAMLVVDQSQPLNQRLTLNNSVTFSDTNAFPPLNAPIFATFGYCYYVRFSKDSYDFTNFLWQVWESKGIELESILP